MNPAVLTAFVDMWRFDDAAAFWFLVGLLGATLVFIAAILLEGGRR